MDKKTIECPNQSPGSCNTKTQHRYILCRFFFVQFVCLRKISYRHYDSHNSGKYFEASRYKLCVHIFISLDKISDILYFFTCFSIWKKTPYHGNFFSICFFIVLIVYLLTIEYFQYFCSKSFFTYWPYNDVVKYLFRINKSISSGVSNYGYIGCLGIRFY